MMKNYKNAFKEVYTVLSYLNDEDYNKIEPKVLAVIANNQNLEYHFEIDKNLEIQKQNFMPETRAILFNIFRDYLATPEQRKKVLKMQNEERQKNELKKKELYCIDVFKNKRKEN